MQTSVSLLSSHKITNTSIRHHKAITQIFWNINIEHFNSIIYSTETLIPTNFVLSYHFLKTLSRQFRPLKHSQNQYLAPNDFIQKDNKQQNVQFFYILITKGNTVPINHHKQVIIRRKKQPSYCMDSRLACVLLISVAAVL